MIIVTGAAGFIGSCLVSKLNNNAIKDIVIVDDFSNEIKNRNILNKVYREKVDRKQFFEWLKKNSSQVDFIFHIGARTDTTEFNVEIFNELNLNYSKKMWTMCAESGIPLIYASSAATYGDGKLGYRDDHELVFSLQPLNPYGISKNDFDKWVLRQGQSPPYWYGLKFFNVFGPNEYHKGRMASVVFHAFNQATGYSRESAVGSRQSGVGSRESSGGSVKLFRSHNPGFKDGGQLRDFIYVKDVIDVLYYLMNDKNDSGIYNLGTGHAMPFLDLANAVFAALSIPPKIEFIDTPADIRDKYQYFTEAPMQKLRSTGYSKPFYTLAEGITEYVQGYLSNQKYF
jgi:ADP-L-glycero-D-manno-heptose 6-epimerase